MRSAQAYTHSLSHTQMYVYIYIYIYIWTHTHSHTRTRTHTRSLTHSFQNTRTQTHMCVYIYIRRLLRASMHPHPQHHAHAQVLGVPASLLCWRNRPWHYANVPPDGPPDNPDRLPVSARVTVLSKRGRALRATFSCSTCSRGVRPRAAMYQGRKFELGFRSSNFGCSFRVCVECLIGKQKKPILLSRSEEGIISPGRER
jgi:hypothetical protein